MSSGLKVAAIPRMMGLFRWPALNSVNGLTKYWGCCPWMIGLAGLPRDPSFEWQETHTLVEIASPFARSGLAEGAGSAAPKDPPASVPSSKNDSSRAEGFMRVNSRMQNSAILQ